jgi:hypothetical protein
MDKGASPTLFTFAMLGNFKVVKSVIESSPGIQTAMGPHGISLLDHAYLMEAVVDGDFDQTATAVGSDGLSVVLDEEFL